MGQIDAMSSIIHTRPSSEQYHSHAYRFSIMCRRGVRSVHKRDKLKNENEEDTHAALCFKSLVIRCSKPKQFNLGVNIPCLECFDFPTISVVFQ